MTLAACPFCSSTDPNTVVINELGRCYRVYCNGCGAAGPIADTEPDAAERWNTSGTRAAFKQAAGMVRAEINRIQDLCKFEPRAHKDNARRFAVLGRIDGLVMLEGKMLERAKE